MDEKLEQVLDILSEISEDYTVPKNIREKCKKISSILKSTEEETRVNVDKALQIMDEISEDQNIPMYTRTQIWSIASILESITYK